MRRGRWCDSFVGTEESLGLSAVAIDVSVVLKLDDRMSRLGGVGVGGGLCITCGMRDCKT